MTDIESLSASLVREYLSRKGFKKTLRQLDEEYPRKEGSIGNRLVLAKELCLERLMRKNKERETPFRAMIEVIVQNLKDKGNTKSDSREKTFRKSPSFENEINHKSSSFLKKSSSTQDLRSLTLPLDERDRPSSPNPRKSQTMPSSRHITDKVTSRLKDKIFDRGHHDKHSRSGDLSYESPDKQSVPASDTHSGRAPKKHSAHAYEKHSRHVDDKHSTHGLNEKIANRIVGGKNDLIYSTHTDNIQLLTDTANNNNNISLKKAGKRIPSGPIHSTTEKSNHARVKKKSAGNLFNDCILPNPSDDNDMDVYLRFTDSLGGNNRNRAEKDMNDCKIDQRFADEATEKPREDRSRAKHSSTVSPKPQVSGDTLLFDDIEGELIEDLQNVSLGHPTATKQLSPLHEDSRPITLELATSLKSLLFGSATCSFNPEWKNQSFGFCELPNLEYGIVQLKGGPCGVLAAVQASVLKHLIFGSDPKVIKKSPPVPSSGERTAALVNALAEILWRAGSRKSATIVKSWGGQKFTGGGTYKADNLTETLNLFTFKSLEKLKNFLGQNIGQFEGDRSSGCILFLYSVILSRGIKKIKSDMDESNGSLIGSHGYCTQELVNLLLTGKSVSNVFDKTIALDSGGSSKSVLKGISKQSEIGFLSLFEHYDSCKVGDHYKNPKYPIWVVCSESHFSVLFSINGSLLNDWKLEEEFDLYYYDGLARQDEEIKLTIDTRQEYEDPEDPDDLVPPLEHCIRTRWRNATVSWNDTEPIL